MYVTVDGVPVIVAFPTVFPPTLPDARRTVLDADVDVDAAVTFTVQAPVAVNLIYLPVLLPPPFICNTLL